MSLPSENLHVLGESYAREFNAYDSLASFRDRFCVQPGTIYLDGNSLGLLSKDAEAALLGALDDWKRLGIAGWLQAEPAWFSLGEELGARTAPLVGAEAEAVVVTGSTTVNLHNLVATFYRPEGARRKILATRISRASSRRRTWCSTLAGGSPRVSVTCPLVPARFFRTRSTRSRSGLAKALSCRGSRTTSKRTGSKGAGVDMVGTPALSALQVIRI